jgi:two-component system, NtrC family, response regulator AtoC
MNSSLIGVSESIKEIREQIRAAAAADLHVVITGETGVGKEVVARNLYRESPRSGKAFIKINCAALPMELVESELFGYERGALIGAHKSVKGIFALADKGVLFLDEICEMPPALQAKLLQVLQGGELTPLGSEKSKTTGAWVLSSTNRVISEEVDNNHFRKDLYYLLNAVNIRIPPLRYRPEDIPALIDYFIDKYSSLPNGTFPIKRPNDRQMGGVMSYPWPGNVRQIQNVIRRMPVTGNWDTILSELQDRAVKNN